MRNNKGVTLVELLIVIVILGIIAAISIPAVGRIVENSQKDAIIADATTVRNALNTYCASNPTEAPCNGEDFFYSLGGEEEAGDPVGGDNAEGIEAGDGNDFDDFYEGLAAGISFAVYRGDDGIVVVLSNSDTGFSINTDSVQSATRADDVDDFEPEEEDSEVFWALLGESPFVDGFNND